jgi:hypothetical protein
MADPKPPEKGHNVEQLFGLYYNQGQRRNLTDVVKAAADQDPPVDVAYITLRRYFDDFDWQGRADRLDEEARDAINKRLVSLVVRHRMREIETVASLQTKFMRRLIPSTREQPNPAEIQPIDLEPRDFIELGKFFELLTGGATARTGVEDTSGALDEMSRAIAAMDSFETPPALPAGEG